MTKHEVESDLNSLKSKLAAVIAEGFSDVVMSCFEALREAIRSSFADDDKPCSEDFTESGGDADTDISVNDTDAGADGDDTEVEEK